MSNLRHTIIHVRVYVAKPKDNRLPAAFFLAKDDVLGTVEEAESRGMDMITDSKEFPLSPEGMLAAMEWAAEQTHNESDEPQLNGVE